MNRSTKIIASRNSQKTIYVFMRFALAPLACIFLFWPLLFEGHILGFRDALHFYYPLWKHLDAREYSDWLIPQFNYYDFVGVPIIGEPTSMVFYPPRLLLKLPWLNLEQCIGLFLSFHLCLCWYTCYYVARWAFGRSALAASLLSSGYAFGGVSYFNIYNPPYLVSSTWLPLAFGSIAILLSGAGRFKTRCNARWQILLTVSLAAMIMGGDVQTPYNLAILCAITIAGRICLKSAARFLRSSSEVNTKWHDIPQCIRNALVSFGFAALICAVQLVPTYYWFRFGTDSADHHRAIGREYTLHVFDALTWLAPMGLGNYTPTHTRWIAAFDTATMWTPSLHSVIPIVAALVLCWRLSRYWRIRWLLLIVSVCVLAAEGDSLGLYWAYSHLLPFYEFRFPFKWYSIAAFALCVLGGYGFDAVRRKGEDLRITRGVLLAIGALNAVVCVGVVLARIVSNESAQFLNVPGDRLCGAFDFSACCSQIALASILTACSCIAMVWMLGRRPGGDYHWRSSSIELLSFGHVVAIAWLMTTTIPTTPLEQNIPSESMWQTENVTMPVYWDAQSAQQKSAELEFSQKARGPIEVAAFQRRWLVGKMHLLTPGRSLFAQLSLTPAFYEMGPKVEWLQPKISPESESSKISVSLCTDLIEISRLDIAEETEIILPILNDGGWSCDEPKVEIVRPENHLLVVRLPEGVKDAKLTYCAPGLRAGAWISFLTLIVFVLVICKRYV